MAEPALWYLQSFKESREVVLIINYDNNRKLINMNNTDLPSLKLAFTHFQTFDMTYCSVVDYLKCSDTNI